MSDGIDLCTFLTLLTLAHVWASASGACAEIAGQDLAELLGRCIGGFMEGFHAIPWPPDLR